MTQETQPQQQTKTPATIQDSPRIQVVPAAQGGWLRRLNKEAAFAVSGGRYGNLEATGTTERPAIRLSTGSITLNGKLEGGQLKGAVIRLDKEVDCEDGSVIDHGGRFMSSLIEALHTARPELLAAFKE